MIEAMITKVGNNLHITCATCKRYAWWVAGEGEIFERLPCMIICCGNHQVVPLDKVNEHQDWFKHFELVECAEEDCKYALDMQ